MSKIKRICVLGGSGFVGQHIVSRLASLGYNVRVLTRHRERHRELLVLPTVEVKTADIHDQQDLTKQFAGMDAVVNLVGILYETSKKQQQFQTVHVDLTHKVMDACHNNHVLRLLHMSALRADPARGTSKYLRSKGQAENLVHTNSGMNVTSFRPSVIFGKKDNFLNRFATLLKMTPKILPFPLACPNAKFAPVYIEDVATAFVSSLENKGTFSQRYNLCGPKAYTLKELVQYISKISGQHRTIIGLGDGLSKAQAILMELAPGNLFSLDNYQSMRTDSLCDDEFPAIFNLKPASIESIAPGYLAADTKSREKFYDYRTHANRDH